MIRSDHTDNRIQIPAESIIPNKTLGNFVMQRLKMSLRGPFVFTFIWSHAHRQFRTSLILFGFIIYHLFSLSNFPFIFLATTIRVAATRNTSKPLNNPSPLTFFLTVPFNCCLIYPATAMARAYPSPHLLFGGALLRVSAMDPLDGIPTGHAICRCYASRSSNLLLPLLPCQGRQLSSPPVMATFAASRSLSLSSNH
jgi:hypothetical protein